MKKIYAFLVAFLCMLSFAQATRYYWVGPVNGRWSDPANWGVEQGSYPYPGGAGVPGPGDNVSFSPVPRSSATINLDVSPTVASFGVGNASTVILVTSVNTTLTVTDGFNLTGTLIDSTTEDVKFNFVLDKARTFVSAISVTAFPSNWIFTGRVPVSSGNGAMLTLTSGTNLNFPEGCSLTTRNNSGDINSDVNSLRFGAGSKYIMENNLHPYIPSATWSGIGYQSAANPQDTVASEISLIGDARSVRQGVSTKFGSFRIDLPNLSDDMDLNLPAGTTVEQNMLILNTNNHLLTLLDGASTTSLVTLSIGPSNYTDVPRIALNLGSYVQNGNSNIALARSSQPATSYRLSCLSFYQSGGNFSLQEANNYTGSSVLSLKSGLSETGGTFITHSTATAPGTKFMVEILGPLYTQSPAGTRYESPAGFSVSSGSIDNATHMVTLRLAQVPVEYTTSRSLRTISPVGLFLRTPLQVGKLELSGGPVISSDTSLLTVANPSPDAIVITNQNSYVAGPMVRATNAAVPYTLPVGAMPVYVESFPGPPPSPFFPDTCVIIPASTTPSQYRARYFRNRYTDTTVTAPFRGVDTSRYWDITKLSGADAQVQLIVNKAVPGATAIDNLVVAHYVNGKWTSEQGTVLSPGNATTGSVSSKVLSSFSPFTFGYGFFTNAPLPIHLLSFDGHAENGGARLNWKVAETASRFEVLRSGDGINFKQVGTVQAQAVQQQYAYLDAQLPAGNSFYRLRMVEKDGSFTLSDVIMISSTGQLTELLTLAPNMVRSTANLRINAVKDGQLQLVVTDMSGRSWKKLTVAVKAGSSSNLLNLADLPAGTYQLTGYLDGQQRPVIRFIKQ